MTKSKFIQQKRREFDEQKFVLGEDANGNDVYLQSDENASIQIKDFNSEALSQAWDKSRQEVMDEIDLLLAMIESTTEDTTHKEMIDMIAKIRKSLLKDK